VDAVSVVALVVALAVAFAQWRVSRDLRAIRAELERRAPGPPPPGGYYRGGPDA